MDLTQLQQLKTKTLFSSNFETREKRNMTPKKCSLSLEPHLSNHFLVGYQNVSIEWLGPITLIPVSTAMIKSKVLI